MGQKQPKSLTLNRETVRDLTTDDLGGVQGGKAVTKKPLCPQPYTTDPSARDACLICPVTCGACEPY